MAEGHFVSSTGFLIVVEPAATVSSPNDIEAEKTGLPHATNRLKKSADRGEAEMPSQAQYSRRPSGQRRVQRFSASGRTSRLPTKAKNAPSADRIRLKKAIFMIVDLEVSRRVGICCKGRSPDAEDYDPAAANLSRNA
jgi:hypothetical protein